MSHLDLSSPVKIDFSDCLTVKALLSSFISLLSLTFKLQLVLLFSAFLFEQQSSVSKAVCKKISEN